MHINYLILSFLIIHFCCDNLMCSINLKQNTHSELESDQQSFFPL